jgi:Arc/MetJ-type ribon-helix-helix transcriptional regulator
MENQRINDFRRPGEKENEMLLVKLTKTQKQRIKMLTDASGFKSISDFVRFTLLNPSFEEKLNLILQSLKRLEEKMNKCI